MRRRVLLAALFVIALPVGVFAPTAMAQETSTNESADYSLSELQSGGTTHEGAPTSMRYLGQYGSATVRHNPVGFGTPDWEYVGSGTQVQRNELTLKTIRLGEPDEALTVHVVGWNRGTRTVETANGTTTEPVATNVTETVVDADLGRGYDEAAIPLPASYDNSQRITMWVEEYPDARWTFQHRSIATARPISINSWGGFLETVIWQIGIFAIPAILGGAALAKRHRKRALVGPQWGVFKWGMAFIVPLGLMASWLAFEGAVIATRVPQALGLLFGPLVYVLVLEGTDPDLETFLFRRQELEDVKSPRGKETKDSRFVDHVVKTGVHRAANEELVLISPGLFPFLARLWGNLATLDITEIQTHKQGKHSPYSLEIELDPSWDIHDALVHKPPRLERLATTVVAEIPYIGRTTIPNPGVVIPLGGGAALGWVALEATLGIPEFGAAAGLLVGLPFIYRVENGGAESEPAPYHFTQGEASLAFESEQFADAKLIDQYRDIAWSERLKTPLDARDTVQKFDASVSRELSNAELGVDGGLDLEAESTEAEGVVSDDD